jgi:two-component system response regulator AtoC
MISTQHSRLLWLLPALDGWVGHGFSDVANVTAVGGRGDFLSALGQSGWRAAVWALEDDSDFALIPRVVDALDGGVLVVTHPQPTVDRVIDAEAAGAAYLLPHPPDPMAIRALLEPYLCEHADHPIPPGSDDEDTVIGMSPALTEAYRTVARVARSSSPVLVSGASGTGKELVARALHDRSDRKEGPFVAVNCAALPEGLLEAELFGHERGAFTGAVGRSEGRFGRADGGTLFLDEIGEMGLGVQAKLLRALETGEIERLGSGETIRVDVRVVAATNRDLEARVAEGAFREDLLYRLAVVRVGIPTLAERAGDVTPLTEAFVARFARRHGREVRALSKEAMRSLQDRAWPGNVRELRNVLDRAVLLARGGVIRSIDLAEAARTPRLSPADPASEDRYSPTLSLREVEERHIRQVLAHTEGHLGDAARILGVHRNTMTVKVREYGIDPSAPRLRTSGAEGA